MEVLIAGQHQLEEKLQLEMGKVEAEPCDDENSAQESRGSCTISPVTFWTSEPSISSSGVVLVLGRWAYYKLIWRCSLTSICIYEQRSA